MKAAVYRHFAANGELLYVGYSANPMLRNQTHSTQASWFGEVVKITIQWFDTQEEALKAEIDAIKRESPRENIKDKTNDLFMKRRKFRQDPFISKKPHNQLDALNRAYGISANSWYYREASITLSTYNDIRESGRELFASEVFALKESLSTTFKKLEQIGIHRGNKG